EFATDIAAVYPKKNITLLHSRNRLLPRFDEGTHLENTSTHRAIVLQSTESLGIEVILGVRLDMPFADKCNEREQRMVKTLSGREIVADLILLCTGQKPNTVLLKDMNPHTIDVKTGLAQISLDGRSDPGQDQGQETTQYPHIFVIGYATDAFGAIKPGHNAYFQASARNVLRLINGSEKPLELYTLGSPTIKVSLGVTKGVYQIDGIIGVNNDGVEDLQASAVWAYYGIRVEDEKEMYD
ncbi:uncharacterized protein EV420DRAFT_1273791, partial [Desarmillaria tabescens]